MLRLLRRLQKNAKIWTPSKPCHVGIHYCKLCIVNIEIIFLNLPNGFKMVKSKTVSYTIFVGMMWQTCVDWENFKWEIPEIFLGIKILGYIPVLQYLPEFGAGLAESTLHGDLGLFLLRLLVLQFHHKCIWLLQRGGDNETTIQNMYLKKTQLFLFPHFFRFFHF